jgi:long-chain acyl-CoA synthetase
LITALYSGAHEVDISTEVTFEDGRKGMLSARVKIRDVRTVPVPAMEKAA